MCANLCRAWLASTHLTVACCGGVSVAESALNLLSNLLADSSANYAVRKAAIQVFTTSYPLLFRQVFVISHIKASMPVFDARPKQLHDGRSSAMDPHHCSKEYLPQLMDAAVVNSGHSSRRNQARHQSHSNANARQHRRSTPAVSRYWTSS